jgi:hypothetical protein
MKLNELIYGESVEALTPGLLTIGDNMKPAEDGSVHFSVRLEPERGNPLRRALLRVEAELLREDADAVGTAHESQRSYEGRAADALVRLVEAWGAYSSGRLEH